MKYALAHCLMGAMLMALSLSGGAAALLLLWPAVSFLAVGLAYARHWPAIFGKCPKTGKLAVANRVALLPYLALIGAIWHGMRLVGAEDPWHPLADGILVGRRLLRAELPDHVRSVVDLTAEFASLHPPSVTYLCVPMLDGTALAAAKLLIAAREMAALPAPLLIHCAQGHGRTSTVAAAVLLVRGQAATVDEALSLVERARPQARPNSYQRRVLAEVARRLG